MLSLQHPHDAQVQQERWIDDIGGLTRVSFYRGNDSFRDEGS